MIDNKQKVWQKIDEQRTDHIGFLQALIRLSQKGEEAIQQRVADKLKELGLEVEMIRYDPLALSTRREWVDPSTVDPTEHISVVGKLPGGPGERSLLLFAQGDTLPVNGTESWQHPPFAGEIEKGRLYGWGVSDDLSGLVAMLAAAEGILAAGLRPKGDLIIASTPSKLHARGIIAVLEQGYEADGVLYVHPAETGVGLSEIKEATLGLLSFRITVPGRLPDTGEPGHTAFHHIAVDPIDKALIVYQALKALNDKRGQEIHHPALDEAIGRSTNLHIAYMHCGQPAKLNRVSPECVLAGSVSIPPGEVVAEVQAQITRALENAANSDDWLKAHPPRIDWLVGIPGAEVSIDHPLYQATSRAITEVTGRKPHPNPMHITSDIRNPMLFNDIPTLGLGPRGGDLTQNGSHDEWVDVEEFIQTIKVLGTVILDWCGT
jgi:acetylornithine deacetylase